MIGFLLRPFVWLFKFLFNFLMFGVITASVLFLVLLLTGNYWLPPATSFLLGKVSGFPVSIEKSKGSLLRGRIDFENVKIKNPSRVFKSENFITLKHVVGDVGIRRLLKKEIVLQELVLDIGDITIVSGPGGISNCSLVFDNLKAVAKEFSNGEKPTKGQAIVEFEGDVAYGKKPLLVQKAELSIGTVHKVDEPTNQSREYVIDYHREFTDVGDFNGLASQLSSDLAKYGISIVVDSMISSVVALPNTAVDGVMKAKDVSLDVVGKTTNIVGSGLRAILPIGN